MNNKIEKEVITLKPFKKFCMTIGELPSSYVETMTYYEMLLWFTKYLQDTIIPTINNNAEAVSELQGLFTELQHYVNNYFDNLDVQEEINNKLDQMAEDGTLTELIFFNNVINVTRPGHNLTPMLFDGTDETTKLQAIIDWALQNNGAKILLPTGSCQISKINIIGHGALNIQIIGMGDSTKLYSVTNNNDTMFNIQTDDNNEQIDNLVLDNFAIIRETSQTEITGIYLNKVCNGCEIKNLLIKGFYIGLHTYKCWTLKITNNNFYQNDHIALYVTSETHNSTIYGNKISYNHNIGMYLRSSYELNIENNDIEGNDGIGIQLYSLRDVNIMKNYIENNGENDATNYNEILIEANVLSANIMFNYINANTVTNAIVINPTSTNINISNNMFVSGNENKKVLKCNGSTTQIQGNFTDNTYSSYGTGLTPLDLGNSQFIVSNYTNNQDYRQSNKTIYRKLVAQDGSYIVRLGKDNTVKLEINYDNNDDPIINVTSGTAGSESYREIMNLKNDLGVAFRKYISFKVSSLPSEIGLNNSLYVASNGALRFKDQNGVIKEITMTDV